MVVQTSRTTSLIAPSFENKNKAGHDQCFERCSKILPVSGVDNPIEVLSDSGRYLVKVVPSFFQRKTYRMPSDRLE